MWMCCWYRGGVYTIDYKGAVEVMKLVNPKITIPMHYKTPALSFDVDVWKTFFPQQEENISESRR